MSKAEIALAEMRDKMDKLSNILRNCEQENSSLRDLLNLCIDQLCEYCRDDHGVQHDCDNCPWKGIRNGDLNDAG